MQKLDHRSLMYGTIGTQERVLVRKGKRAIRVQAIEVLLYQVLQNMSLAGIGTLVSPCAQNY